MMELREFQDRWAGHVPGLLGGGRRYAVLVPLIDAPGGVRLLFEVRAAALRQGGEVCFPGGRAEPGETAEQCALRETQEELGISPDAVTVLGRADFLVHHRGFLLQPVLGIVDTAAAAAMTPSPGEVQSTFTVPAEFFRATPPELYHYELQPCLPADFPYETLGIAPDYPWGQGRAEVPVWRYDGHVIWGITGRILKSIMEQMS